MLNDVKKSSIGKEIFQQMLINQVFRLRKLKVLSCQYGKFYILFRLIKGYSIIRYSAIKRKRFCRSGDGVMNYIILDVQDCKFAYFW